MFWRNMFLSWLCQKNFTLFAHLTTQYILFVILTLFSVNDIFHRTEFFNSIYESIEQIILSYVTYPMSSTSPNCSIQAILCFETQTKSVVKRINIAKICNWDKSKYELLETQNLRLYFRLHPAYANIWTFSLFADTNLPFLVIMIILFVVKEQNRLVHICKTWTIKMIRTLNIFTLV